MPILTRQGLARYFEERMTKSYSQLREKQRLEPTTWLVKTYMLEAHVGGNGAHEDVATKLSEASRDVQEGRDSQARVLSTEEDRFIALEVEAKGQQITLYVDATDPRFWLVHSMDPSEPVDWFIERLTRATPDLDRAWLPIDLLESAAKAGAFRGLGLDFDRRSLIDEEEDEQEMVTFLKMQLWGNRAPEVLRILRGEEAFPHETTLSKIKLKFWLDDDDSQFSIDTIKFDGKTTASGTSFQCHLALVTDLYRRYAKAIQNIEQVARIIYESERGGWCVRGSPVYFSFRTPIADPGQLCDRLFTCGPPFRLWGVPVRLGNNYFRVSGVDLHAGHPIDFEVGKNWMRVYLHKGSCGNTILRLLTNLQHTVDSQVEAKIDGKPISEF